jgi:myosin heavy subunit
MSFRYIDTRFLSLSVKELNKTHTNFVSGKLHSRTELGVHHLAVPVIYDASKFVEKNSDKLPDFLMSDECRRAKYKWTNCART